VNLWFGHFGQVWAINLLHSWSGLPELGSVVKGMWICRYDTALADYLLPCLPSMTNSPICGMVQEDYADEAMEIDDGNGLISAPDGADDDKDDE
jgi:hypothetical protein